MTRVICILTTILTAGTIAFPAKADTASATAVVYYAHCVTERMPTNLVVYVDGMMDTPALRVHLLVAIVQQEAVRSKLSTETWCSKAKLTIEFLNSVVPPVPSLTG